MKLRSGRIIAGAGAEVASKLIREHIDKAYQQTGNVKMKLLCVADLYDICTGPLLFEFVFTHPEFKGFRMTLIQKTEEYERDLNHMIDNKRLLRSDIAYIRLTQCIENFKQLMAAMILKEQEKEEEKNRQKEY